MTLIDRLLSQSKILSIWLVILPLMVACKNDEPPLPEEPQLPETGRSVFVYMAANHNLGQLGYDRMDLAEMDKGVKSGALDGGRLLVYHAPHRRTPYLVEITPDRRDTLKVYDKDGRSPMDPTLMSDVLDDMAAFAPSRSNDYGLVLWSHGTGWCEDAVSLPRKSPEGVQSRFDFYDNTTVNPLSFGQDGVGSNKKTMKVTALADVIRDRNLAFVYFDCCLMGSVEVIYELRDAAPWIVASGTELQVYGMRYDLNLPVFFSAEPDMIAAARNTFESYRDFESGSGYPDCTMSVYETKYFSELADATRAIMERSPQLPADYSPIPYRHLYREMFDMHHYINALEVDRNLIDAWNRVYEKAVPYYDSSDKYGELDTLDYKGLGCFIPEDADDTSYLGYSNYSWWRDVTSYNPLFQ